MLCDEHRRLTAQLTRLVSEYIEVFARLRVLPAGEEFDETWFALARLRQSRDLARQALFDHERQHGCSTLHEGAK